MFVSADLPEIVLVVSANDRRRPLNISELPPSRPQIALHRITHHLHQFEYSWQRLEVSEIEVDLGDVRARRRVRVERDGRLRRWV